MSIPEPTIESTAKHEAGHTVARLRAGHLAYTTSINPDPHEEGNLGASCGEDERADTAGIARDKVLIWLAGFAAVAAAGLPDPDVGCGNDFEEAADLLSAWQLGELDDWKQRAVELMRQPENLRAVDVFAAELLLRRSFDGQHAVVLLQLADGEITAAEFEQWKQLAGLA